MHFLNTGVDGRTRYDEFSWGARKISLDQSLLKIYRKIEKIISNKLSLKTLLLILDQCEHMFQ